MKLSLKLEYACRVLAQLAPTFATGQVRRIDDLGEREEVSPNYLTQILNELRTAGIVESRRGKHGGYLLARDPAAVTLLDVVMAVEGSLLQVNSDGGGESGDAVNETWSVVFGRLDEQLGAVTLAEIVARKAERALDFTI